MPKTIKSVKITIVQSIIPQKKNKKRTNSSSRDEFIRGSTLIKGICLSLNACNARLRIRILTFERQSARLSKITSTLCPNQLTNALPPLLCRDCFQSLTFPLCDLTGEYSFRSLPFSYLINRICKIWGFVNCFIIIDSVKLLNIVTANLKLSLKNVFHHSPCQVYHHGRTRSRTSGRSVLPRLSSKRNIFINGQHPDCQILPAYNAFCAGQIPQLPYRTDLMNNTCFHFPIFLWNVLHNY